MADNTYYGTGKRKDAVARVWLTTGGAGNITVNDRPLDEYFPRVAWQKAVREVLTDVEVAAGCDIKATAKGGGVSGQAGAVRHGIAKALLELDPDLRVSLRAQGMLTRDPRVKERKKYGRKRARRGFQFSKR